MQPLAILEHLDVLEHRRAGLGLGAEVLVVDHLGLQFAPERLDHRVVITVARAAHARLDAVVIQQLAVAAAGVLHAAVGVMQKTRVGRPHAELPAHARADSQPVHEPGDGLAVDLHMAVAEFLGDLEAAVDALGLVMHHADLLGEFVRADSASARGAFEPSVEARGGDAEDGAHGPDVEDAAVVLDVGELHRFSFAK